MKTYRRIAKILGIWFKRGHSHPLSYLYQKLPALLAGVIVVYSLFLTFGGARLFLTYLIGIILLGQNTELLSETEILHCEDIVERDIANTLCPDLWILPYRWEGTTLKSWGISKKTYDELVYQSQNQIDPFTRTPGLSDSYLNFYMLLLIMALLAIISCTLMLWLSRERLGQRERQNYLSTLMLLGVTRRQALGVLLIMRGAELVFVYLFSALLFRLTISFTGRLTLFSVPIQPSLFYRGISLYLVTITVLTVITLAQNLYLFQRHIGQISGAIGPQTEIHLPVSGNWSPFQAESTSNLSISGASFAALKMLFSSNQPGGTRYWKWWRIILVALVIGFSLIIVMGLSADYEMLEGLSVHEALFTLIIILTLMIIFTWGGFYYLPPIILRGLTWPFRQTVSSPSTLVALRTMQQYQHQFWDAIAPGTVMVHLFLLYRLIIMELGEVVVPRSKEETYQGIITDMELGITVTGIIVLLCCVGCLYNSLLVDLQARWEQSLSLLRLGWSKWQILSIKIWRLALPTVFAIIPWFLWTFPLLKPALEKFDNYSEGNLILSLVFFLYDLVNLIPKLGWVLIISLLATTIAMLAVEWHRLRQAERN